MRDKNWRPNLDLNGPTGDWRGVCEANTRRKIHLKEEDDDSATFNIPASREEDIGGRANRLAKTAVANNY